MGKRLCKITRAKTNKRQSAQCLLCKKILSYNGATASNLLRYLSSKHPSTVQVQKDNSTESTMAMQLSMKQFSKQHKGKFTSNSRNAGRNT